MNDKPAATPPAAAASGNNISGLLTTLASSGDNWVKLLIVGGLIVNGFLTKQSGSATRHDVDKVRDASLKQIRTIYANQHVWAQYAEATVEEHRLIMEKLGIPENKWPRMPPMRFNEPDNNEEEGDTK